MYFILQKISFAAVDGTLYEISVIFNVHDLIIDVNHAKGLTPGVSLVTIDQRLVTNFYFGIPCR